jgi:flagellar biosynthesis component FlhA
MIDAGASTRDPRQIAEAVRRAIVPANLRRRDIALLEPLIVGPEVEAELLTSWSPDGDLAPRPETVLALRSAVDDYVATVRRDRAAVICTAALRPNLAELLRRFGATVEVFAYGEVPPEIELRPAAVAGRRSS